ncbi:MAG: hypothetical protein HY962_13915 [Ignavibacteriae bacterium]|nr:hypothetical protein [Ignavibacteriota bacterium]
MKTILTICFAAILLHINAGAQWLRYGLPLTDPLSAREFFYPRLIPDGTGGAFVTWEDVTYGVRKDVYIQRVNNDGRPLWERYGKQVSITDSVRQQYLEVTPMYNGAVTMAWVHYPYVRVQKIDTAGQEYWASGGVVINSASRPAGLVDVTPDGAGGMYVVSYNWDFTRPWIQRVDSGGRPMWGDSCVLLSQRPDSAAYIAGIDVLCADSSGDVYVAWIERWTEKRTDVDHQVYIQKFDRNGVAQWTENGIPVAEHPNWNWQLVKLVEDNAGGVYVFWYKEFVRDQAAQHFDKYGKCSFGTDGVVLMKGRSKGDMLPDGKGGVYLYYTFLGAPNFVYYEAQHYSNNLDSSYWNPTRLGHHGVTVVDESNGYRKESFYPECEASPDGKGGLFITGGQYGSREHWVQWIDSTGTARWTAPGSATVDGIEVETNPPRPAAIHHQLIRMVKPGEAFLVWAQLNSGELSYQLYLAKITTSGVVSVQSLASKEPNDIQLGYTYPSPAAGDTTISGNNGAAGHLTLTLHDIQGRELGSVFDGEREAGPFSVPYNVSHLAPGTYYIHASNGTTRSVLPLIVYRTR